MAFLTENEWDAGATDRLPVTVASNLLNAGLAHAR